MIRSLFRFIAAVSLVLVLPAVPHAASGPGLQYDEIVRMVVGATPPPPGNFQADLAAIASPAAVAATQAPKRKHGFGNLGALASNLLSGNVTGAVTGAATDAVVGNVMDAQMDRMLAATTGAFAGALRGLTQGRVERHSFYAGWERVDDVAAQTATIRKCDLHQVINLDLAKKTYSIVDPTARASEAPTAPAPRSHERSEATPAPERPGTAVADFTNVVSELGPRKLDGVDTTGYDDTSKFALTQATGSCRNGSFTFHSKTYYSRLATPRLVCPIDARPPQRYPQRPENFVAQGGCRPTFSAHKSGPVPPAQNLSMYSTIAMNGSNGDATPAPGGSPAPGFVFLTERGNLRSLGSADAGSFEIPRDFTRVP
jgi:hypothetical protein